MGLLTVGDSLWLSAPESRSAIVLQHTPVLLLGIILGHHSQGIDERVPEGRIANQSA